MRIAKTLLIRIQKLEPISKMWIRVPRFKAEFHILILGFELLTAGFDSAEPLGREPFGRELRVERLEAERLVAGLLLANPETNSQ